MMFRSIVLRGVAAGLLVLSLHAQAVRYQGQDFADTLQLGGKPLVLSGIGERAAYGFHGYSAALYMTAKATTPEAVYAVPGPKRLEMRITLPMKLRPRSSMAVAQSFRGIEGGRDDRHIAGAAAKMPTEELAQLGFGWIGRDAQVPVERHQDAGGAEAALQRVMAAERLLQHREASGLRRESLDRAQRRAVHLHREGEARACGRAVDLNRAGTAHAVLATDMGSGQLQVFPQKIREIEPRQYMRVDALAVDLERDWHGSRHAAPPALRSGRRSSAATQRRISTPAKWRRMAADAC